MQAEYAIALSPGRYTFQLPEVSGVDQVKLFGYDKDRREGFVRTTLNQEKWSVRAGVLCIDEHWLAKFWHANKRLDLTLLVYATPVVRS